MAHPWMNKGHSLPFGPAPFPNRLRLADISDDVVDHMVHTLKVGPPSLKDQHVTLLPINLCAV